MKKIMILVIMILLIGCDKPNNVSKNVETKEEKTKEILKIENKTEIQPQTIKTEPFENKIVYRHIEKGIDTFIVLLDEKTNETKKIKYNNKIISTIVLNKENNKYYFIDGDDSKSSLISLNPKTGEFVKVFDDINSNVIQSINNKLYILSNKFCNVEKDLGIVLFVFKDDKKEKEICLKGSVARNYLNENGNIYYTGFTSDNKEYVFEFDTTKENYTELVKKDGKIVPIVYTDKTKLYYYAFLSEKNKFFEYDLTTKEEKEINMDFLGKDLKDNQFFTILAGFKSNRKNYIYVAYWIKDKQINGIWFELNEKFEETSLRKLDFKAFSYNISKITENLILVGNELFKL